jgi:hypothetical protein
VDPRVPSFMTTSSITEFVEGGCQSSKTGMHRNEDDIFEVVS